MTLSFTARLRDPIRRGEITTSIRIWQGPRVRVGGRYRLEPGHVQVTGLREIALQQVTPAMARESGFAGLVDLLKVARHGPGRRVYMVEFEYIEPGT